MRSGSDFARWFLGGALVIVGVLYLNSAAYSAWAAGGPPTHYPHAWLRRAALHLGYAIAAFCAGAVVTLLLRRPTTRVRRTLAALLIAVAIACLAVPRLIHTTANASTTGDIGTSDG